MDGFPSRLPMTDGRPYLGSWTGSNSNSRECNAPRGGGECVAQEAVASQSDPSVKVGGPNLDGVKPTITCFESTRSPLPDRAAIHQKERNSHLFR